jgi:hypothetical protein
LFWTMLFERGGWNNMTDMHPYLILVFISSEKLWP